MPTDPATLATASAALDPALAPAAGGLRLRIHVCPRAAANRMGTIVDTGHGPRLSIHVTAPPHGGKANEAVIRFLASAWRLPKSALGVVAGATGRDKVIFIRGDAEALRAKLAGAVPTPAGVEQ